MKTTRIRAVRLVMVTTLTAAAVAMLDSGAVVGLSAGSAGAAGCPKSIVVTDGNLLAAAVAQVCPGGTVNIAPAVADIWSYPIVVDKAVRVRGPGQAITTIYGGRPFEVTSTGSLELSGVTLSGGTEWAIKVAGALKLAKVTVTGFFPTAIWALPGSVLKLTSGTLITGNSGGHFDWEGGGGIYNDGGSVTLTGDAAVTNNVNWGCNWIWIPGTNRYILPGGMGGGIFSKNGGSIVLNDHAVVSGNIIHYCDTAKGDAPTGWGGGIYAASGSVTLNGSASVTGNGAGRGGGIAGGSSVTGLASSADITLTHSATVSGNLATAAGGGIFNWIDGTVTMHDAATVSGNTAEDYGGGIYNGSGTVTMSQSSLVTGNTAGGLGGGVYSLALFDNAIGTLVLHDAAAVTGNTPSDIYP